MTITKLNCLSSYLPPQITTITISYLLKTRELVDSKIQYIALFPKEMARVNLESLDFIGIPPTFFSPIYQSATVVVDHMYHKITDDDQKIPLTTLFKMEQKFLRPIPNCTVYTTEKGLYVSKRDTVIFLSHAFINTCSLSQMKLMLAQSPQEQVAFRHRAALIKFWPLQTSGIVTLAAAVDAQKDHFFIVTVWEESGKVKKWHTLSKKSFPYIPDFQHHVTLSGSKLIVLSRPPPKVKPPTNHYFSTRTYHIGVFDTDKGEWDNPQGTGLQESLQTRYVEAVQPIHNGLIVKTFSATYQDPGTFFVYTLQENAQTTFKLSWTKKLTYNSLWKPFLHLQDPWLFIKDSSKDVHSVFNVDDGTLMMTFEAPLIFHIIELPNHSLLIHSEGRCLTAINPFLKTSQKIKDPYYDDL